jgi:hypothetical protein
MIIVRPASEDEVVLAFLQAEIDSSRFKEIYCNGLARLGFERSLIEQPDLTDVRANAARLRLLQIARGFGANAYLFTDFPTDVRWNRVTLESEDFETMRYARTEPWISFSKGTRLVTVGAQTITSNPGLREAEQIRAIAEAHKNGVHFAELIVAECSSGSLILIEGHSRATAYVQTQLTKGLEAFVGSSTSMSKWNFY